MKKKMTTLLLAAILLAFPFINAGADVIFEPADDFYSRHSNECEYLGRRFYANGDDGYVSMLSEPASGKRIATVENGEILGIQFIYDNAGEIWGVGYDSGWAPMSDLILVYDAISFNEDHKHEFDVADVDVDALINAGYIVFWTWPGSGEISMEYVPSADNKALERSWLEAAYTYTDDEGRVWGYIPYFYAARSQWVCLSDPSNKGIPAFNEATAPTLKQPGNSPLEPDVIPGGPTSYPSSVTGPPDAPDPPPDGPSMLGLILVLVGFLVVATAVLIGFFWNRKKSM